MRLNFPLGCERALLSSTWSWPNEAESTAQAASSLWEEIKHQPRMPKTSGMHQAGGEWQQEPCLHWSCQRYSDLMAGEMGDSLFKLPKTCKLLSYIHNTAIAPLHWTRPHRAAKTAIKTLCNYSKWVQTNFTLWDQGQTWAHFPHTFFATGLWVTAGK